MKLVFCLSLLFLGCVEGSAIQAQNAAPSTQPSDIPPDAVMPEDSRQGSVYVPVDSWIYPALERLHALGYADTAYLGLRPWTRLSIAQMLLQSADSIAAGTDNDLARSIYAAVLCEVQPGSDRDAAWSTPHIELESVYTRMRGITGSPLRDSFHIGQSLVNDYGRPYEPGFNNYTGLSLRAAAGRFSLYLRGEFQHAPSAAGYSPALAAFLSDTLDGIPFVASPRQATIPEGPIAVANDPRVVEANFSYHLLGHEISFGKNDHWLGPAKGASMLWGNNAENIYDFEINRVEPLRIPGLSRLTGPFRYDFFVGSLKGHTYPNDPWVHVEKISFKPSRNLELGFSRMAIWGGKDHAPITLRTFLHSFFSVHDVSPSEKYSTHDPGYRLGNFDFSYRLPYLRKWVTLYTDSITHDSVNPTSNPPRSGWRPGIYLARLPGLEQIDLRVEGTITDTPVWTVQTGQYTYWEAIQRQGPTNKGFLVGDWVGRQGKGGQAWLTYHLSPQEEVQLQYRNAKAATGFIPGGTTEHVLGVQVRKRVRQDFEVLGWAQFESWKAPIYLSGARHDSVTALQITWFPRDAKLTSRQSREP